MKKIIFCDIPMKSNLKAMDYKGTGNVNSCYDKPVIYPINAILADTIKKDDEIKVILLRTANPTENNLCCLKLLFYTHILRYLYRSL